VWTERLVGLRNKTPFLNSTGVMWTEPKPLFSNIPVPVAVFLLGIVSSVKRDTQVIFSYALNKFLCHLHHLYLSNITRLNKACESLLAGFTQWRDTAIIDFLPPG